MYLVVAIEVVLVVGGGDGRLGRKLEERKVEELVHLANRASTSHYNTYQEMPPTCQYTSINARVTYLAKPPRH